METVICTVERCKYRIDLDELKIEFNKLKKDYNDQEVELRLIRQNLKEDIITENDNKYYMSQTLKMRADLRATQEILNKQTSSNYFNS